MQTFSYQAFGAWNNCLYTAIDHKLFEFQAFPVEALHTTRNVHPAPNKIYLPHAHPYYVPQYDRSRRCRGRLGYVCK